MPVLLATTLTIAVVPVLAVIALVLLSVFVLSRRGARLTTIRDRADDWQRSIVKSDQQLKLDLVTRLIAGKPFDRAYSAYCTARGQLLPGANLESPHAWTADDLQAAYRGKLDTGGEAANRRLIVPAAGATAFLVAATVCVCAVLYQFDSTAQTPGPTPAVPTFPLAGVNVDLDPPLSLPEPMPEPTLDPTPIPQISPADPASEPPLAEPEPAPSAAPPNPQAATSDRDT